MGIRSDKRAQSIQVGAILFFGMLVLAFTMFQVQGVPEENKQVEYQHSQQVGDEMLELYTAIFDTVETGEQGSTTITLGTEYNSRLYFIYPPPTAGTLQTTDSRSVALHNISAVDDGVSGSYDNYWNNDTRSYSTSAITYTIDYTELRGTGDYRLEYGSIAAQYPNITQLRHDDIHQPIVDGTEIDLVLYDGDLQAVHPNAETVLPYRATESSTVPVTSDTDSEYIVLELPTQLSEDSWNMSESGSMLYGEEFVEDVEHNGDTVVVYLDGSEEYDMTIHKVDVAGGADDPAPRYLKNQSLDGSESTFQIRTQYNDLPDETVDVAVFNSTNDITRELSVDEGEETFSLNEQNDECGVSLDSDIDDANSFERLNITDPCSS